MPYRPVLFAFALAITGCGDDSPPASQGASASSGSGGSPDSGSPCPSDEIERDDGTCDKSGVPADACGEGFVADDIGGCVAVLPPETCPKGQLAVPGETRCHEVAPCGTETWDGIPVEPDTVFVDAAYAGGDGAGTQAKPFPTISEAVIAAAPGAIVAVAAGTYDEVVSIDGKPVRLWGRCPELVAITAAKPALGAIVVLEGAEGTEVRRVALRGTTAGIAASGSENVLVEEVWADGSLRGIDVEDSLGTTTFVIRRSLMEGVKDTGLLVLGADVTLEDSVVRGTIPHLGQQSQGIGAEENLVNKHASKLHVRRSVVEQNIEYGIILAGAEATIESTVVRETKATAGGIHGIGVAVQDAPIQETTATLRQLVIADNTYVGVYVSGATTTIDATVIRGTLPQPSDMTLGRGISVEPNVATSARADVEVTRSLLIDNVEVGFIAFGSDARLEGVAVRDTKPRAFDQAGGRGIGAQDHVDAGRADVRVRSSVIAHNHDAGVFVWAADATLEGVVVDGTIPRPDGRFGDGALAANQGTLAITNSRITNSARAGVSNFGSHLSIEASTFACNPIDLDAESVRAEATFDDRGNNVCGCEVPGSCQIVSSMLDPPQAL